MAQFVAGDDPADHTVAEVVEYLNGDEITGDEHDRIVSAERENRNRVGIMSGSGAEEPAADAGDGSEGEKPDGSEAAGPNEAATGDYSPADHAKTSSDPQASGDAGVTADQYPDDAPASLGPDMPQSDAEQDAHDQTVLALSREQYAALPADVREGADPVRDTPYTPAEALEAASDKARRRYRPLDSRATETTELS